LKTKHKVVGIGEVLWDIFPAHRLPGGAPANVVFHAAQMGADAVLCSRVGIDDPGRELLAYLREQGIDVEAVQQDLDHPTGSVTVDLSRRDHPAFTIHADVAWDFMELNRTWENVLAGADAVCFGSLAQRFPKSRETIMKGLDAAGTAVRIFDVNVRPPWIDAKVLRDSTERSDIVKLNDEETGTMANMLGADAFNDSNFAAELLDTYEDIQVVSITRGAKGCLLMDRTATVELPGVKVDVADTVGAGDAFTAGLTIGILEGWDLRKIAEFANRAAALVAAHPGAMPVLREEYQTLRRELDA
jgi:fructokinase